ncbi:MAG: energy-coupling factor transporter transmembrane component T [bacterium]
MRFAFRRDVALGTYLPGDSPVHALDPRTKLLAFALVVLTLFRTGLPGAAGLVALAVAVSLVAGTGAARLVRLARSLLWVLLITFLFQAFWVGPGLAGGTREGAERGLLLVARLLGMMGWAVVLTTTTEPIRLADGLARLFGWLERLRVPVRDLALVLTLALRFLPTVLEEAERIVTAQRARGARFEGNPLKRARALLPLAVPLFVGCLRRADTLALAMEARGFGRGPRTQLDPLAFGARDLWTLAGLSLILAGALALGPRG